ncbi:MAG TPA: sigma-70 family RNA polymerase sigma factor [Verrucomicrobiae bacterium]|nr:sigma-70 family RNA polymerase sigma factor [Verrucomicrobiae bacterium]
MPIETTLPNNSVPTAIPIFEKEPDLHLVDLAKHGSQPAFEMLFKRYEHRMLLIANRIVRNQQDAEDAVQLAFTNAFMRLRAFQGDARFSTWLTRITINESLQLLRKRRPGHSSLDGYKAADGEMHPLQIADAAATPEENSDHRELSGILHQAIRELRPIFRNVIQMHEIAELTSERTAELLGLSTAVVKARTFRARRVLRRKLASRLGISRKSARQFFAASGASNANPRRAGTLVHAI